MKSFLPKLQLQLSTSQKDMNNSALFECQDLDIGYSTPLASDINLSISSGKIMFVKGKNGTGKSTLIKTILGQMKPLGGRYDWNIEKTSISYLPQMTNPNSQFSFTIKEILDLYDIDPDLREKLPPGLEKKKWINASGGEKQKVMLLSRISKNTRVLILDEPFNHLDQESIDSISVMLATIVKENQLSVILVSHLNVELPSELQQSLELKQ